MISISTKVYAKFNLSLCITGKKDGMHLLDMITYPIKELYDEVTLSFSNLVYSSDNSNKINIVSAYDGLDVDRFINFLTPKVEDLSKKLGVYGTFNIKKNIPLGAGIGGSSAVIAGIYKVMTKVAQEYLSNEELVKYGSDVPCIVQGGICRVSGIGEKVEQLVNEGINYEINMLYSKVDTAECYATFDRLCEINANDIPTTLDAAKTLLRNDLFIPACVLNPEIKEVYNTLVEKYGKNVIMSGSGSTLIVLK